MTITEFLEQRIADDEAAVLSQSRSDMGADWIPAPTSGARVLAECKAKRAIVEIHTPQSRTPYDCSTCGSESADFYSSDLTPIPFPCPTIRALASVYADHPDFESGWAL